MPVDDQTELVRALERHDAKAVLGTPESSWVEFKDPRAYPLDTDASKWELAKDVAAMANADGGLLVIGIYAKKDRHDTHEPATDLCPFPKTTYNIDRLRSVIADWLTPSQTVAMNWFADSPGSDLHYLVITVKPVPEADRYVLTTKAVFDDGKMKPAVGVHVRAGDSTRWLRAEEIYRLVNDGWRRRDDTSPRLETVPAATPPVDAQSNADAHLSELERSQGWGDKPAVFWQSYGTPGTVDQVNLYSHDGVRGFLDGPNALRPKGFHFHNPYVPTTMLESGLLLASRDGLVVHIGFDGTVTAGAVANRTILARSQDSDKGLPISAIVLTELTYEYFRLADEHVLPLAPGAWRHRVVVRRFREHGVTLSPGETGEYGLGQKHDARMGDWRQDWEAAGDAAVDAGHAVRVVYNHFRLDAATNPWFADDRVDIERFIEAMNSRA